MKRRLAFGGAAVAVIAVVVALVVYRLSDGEASAPDAGDTGWNAVAVLDRDAGEIVVVDAGGAELDRFDAGVDEPATLDGARGSYVIVHDVSDEPQSAIVDMSTGEIAWSGAHETLTARWLPGTTEPVAARYDVGGSEEADIIYPPSGDAVDVFDAAGFQEPWIADGCCLADPDGEAAVVIDNATDGLAAAVVDLHELDTGEPAVVTVTGRFLGFGGPGEDVLAFVGATEEGDDRLVLIDRAGDELGSIEVPGIVGAAVLDQRSAVVSTGDGELLHVDVDEDESVELADLDGSVLIRAIPGADRLLATSIDGQQLISVDGDELTLIEGSRVFTPINGRTACLHVVDNDDVAHLIDVVTGDDLASTEHVDSADMQSSADGCTVTYRTSGGIVVLDRSGATEHDAGSVVDVAPDGSAVLVMADAKLVLLDLDDPSAEPLDTGFERAPAVFVNR